MERVAQHSNTGHRTQIAVAALLVLLWMYLCVPLAMSLIPLGGNSSDKVIEVSGGADSSLLITRDGVADSGLQAAMGAIVSTQDATQVRFGNAVLHGTVSDLNGHPSAEVWFEWGYDTGYGNTVGGQIVGVGTFQTTIHDFDGDQTVHFRAVSSTDGILYGGDQSFNARAVDVGWSLMDRLLPILIGLGVIFMVLAFAGAPLVMLVAALLGIIGFAVVVAIIDAVF